MEGEPPVVVQDPLGSGKKVMRAVLKTDSVRPERSEVRWDTIKPGEERWVGVRLLSPEAHPQPFLCLFQLGPIVYSNKNDKANGGWAQILQKASPGDGQDKWGLRLFFDRFGGVSVNSPEGAIDFGNWQQWIFHVKASAEDGILEVWKDDEKVYELKGQNAKESRYMLLPVKWGVYIGMGNTLIKNVTAYYSAVVIADENFDHAQMAAELSK